MALLCSLPRFASSIALLSDEVEHGKCLCFIAGPNCEWKCSHRGVHSHLAVPSLASVRFGRGVGAVHECSRRLLPGLYALVVQRASPQRRHSGCMWFQDSASFLGGGHWRSRTTHSVHNCAQHIGCHLNVAQHLVLHARFAQCN